MGLLTNLFKLIQPTLPAGWCPTSYQELADTLIGGTQVTFLIDNGNFLYNYGSSTPAPENRIFPWLNTDDGLWYNFKYGLWVAPINQTDLEPDFRRIWMPAMGTPESDAWSLDGGDGTDPSVPANIGLYYGAFWEVDHTMDGRFPLGAGTIPNSDLGGGSASVGINQIADSFGREGEYAHQLTEAEGAVGQHEHGVGIFNPTGDDAFFNQKATQTTTTYTGRYMTGSGAVIPATETTADIFTLPANLGAGVVSDKHNTMPGYRGVWFLKHTIRSYRTRPA